jgi:hypothetical protein
MKARNRINAQTAQQYIKGHQMFQSQLRLSKMHSKTLSSFYVEIQEEYLPEPLILTVLLDSRSPHTYHLSIEKTQPANTPQHLIDINNLLFGGNKGYTWMHQFLGLMHTVALEPALTKTYPRHTVMTQYMLKLLTILSNILVTNL